MTKDAPKPSHRPPPPLKEGEGLGEPAFDDRPQHEDELLSDLVRRSDPEEPAEEQDGPAGDERANPTVGPEEHDHNKHDKHGKHKKNGKKKDKDKD